MFSDLWNKSIDSCFYVGEVGKTVIFFENGPTFLDDAIDNYSQISIINYFSNGLFLNGG